MKIRMMTLSAGPGGILEADSVVEVPDHVGQGLIDTLHAVPAPDAKVTARWPHPIPVQAPQQKAK